MLESRRRSAVAVLVVVAALAVLAAQAAAATPPSGAGLAMPSGLHFASAPRSGPETAAAAVVPTQYSPDLAGYGTGVAATSLSTEFKAPGANCAATTTDSGFAPLAFANVGPSGSVVTDGAGLLVQCFSQKLQLNPAIIADGTQTNYTNVVRPGDLISVSVSISGATVGISLSDLTAPRTFTLTGSGTGATADSEFAGVDSLVSQTTGNPIPIPPGAAASFTATDVDGAPIGTTTPTPIDLANGCAIGLVAGALTTGNAFSVHAPAIQISGLSPTGGPAGTSVAITGVGFNSTSTVKFSGQPATSVTRLSATQVDATVPTTATTGAVTVVNTAAPVGSGMSACKFAVTPMITSFTPASGPTGSTVTINGSGFSQVIAVAFGTHRGTFRIVSSRQITVVVPNGDTPSTITVTTTAGAATSATTFTPTLAVTAFRPPTGPVKQLVTITGVGFNAGSKVSFNGTASTSVTFVSATDLQATVPTGATTGLLSVTNSTAPVGTASSVAKFTVTPSIPPSISSFTPTSGITGSTVTITGAHLTDAGKVMFGTRGTKFTVNSDTQITATVPNGAAAGDISVTTVVGTGTSTTPFTPTLSIISFTPATGAPGATVTINGIGFTASSTVTFNGTAAASVTFVSSTKLQAKVPAAVTAGPISVTNTVAPVGTVSSPGHFS